MYLYEKLRSMKKIVLTVFFGFSLCLLTQGQSREERKALKEQEKLALYEQTKGLIETGSFSFVADWMQSRHGIRRRVLNRLAYLRVSDGNAEAYLPYFGVVRAGAAHDGGGIEFNDAVSDYQESFDDEELTIALSFKVAYKTEHYQVEMNLVKGNFVHVVVHSSKRDSMDYEGFLYPFEE